MIGFERENDEIVRYYNGIAEHDRFGVWGTELLLRLPLRMAIPYMTTDHGWNEDTWARQMFKKDHESVYNEIEDYFQFAWEIAIEHREMASLRSIHHFLAWSWLLNDSELSKFLSDPRNYPNFGCPMILGVAQQYDLMDLLPTRKEHYEVFMLMASGKPCVEKCEHGCVVGYPRQIKPLDIAVPPNGQSLILPK
jgi:hypothetical protein